MNEQENKNRRIGILTSLGIHAGVFLLLFFLVAWRAPNPPLPEFGIELNFGLDDQGSGDVQPITPVGDQSDQQNEEIKEKSSEEQPEEVKPDVKEEVNEADKSHEKVDSKLESDVALKEEKKEVKPDVVKDKPKDANPKEKVITEYKKKDEKKEINPTDGSKKGDIGNQGDDKKTGDKGNPEGKLDAKALYGTPGGGGGGNGLGLQMNGWAWADPPKIPELPDNENGKVIFEIECDENGDIVGIKTDEHGLSLKAEQILITEIRKGSLVWSSKGPAPKRSKGKIVFILKSK